MLISGANEQNSIPGLPPQWAFCYEHSSYSLLYNIFQKVEKQGTFPVSFCDASITLIPNQTKAFREKKRTDQYLS